MEFCSLDGQVRRNRGKDLAIVLHVVNGTGVYPTSWKPLHWARSCVVIQEPVDLPIQKSRLLRLKNLSLPFLPSFSPHPILNKKTRFSLALDLLRADHSTFFIVPTPLTSTSDLRSFPQSQIYLHIPIFTPRFVKCFFDMSNPSEHRPQHLVTQLSSAYSYLLLSSCQHHYH